MLGAGRFIRDQYKTNLIDATKKFGDDLRDEPYYNKTRGRMTDNVCWLSSELYFLSSILLLLC